MIRSGGDAFLSLPGLVLAESALKKKYHSTSFKAAHPYRVYSNNITSEKRETETVRLCNELNKPIRHFYSKNFVPITYVAHGGRKFDGTEIEIFNGTEKLKIPRQILELMLVDLPASQMDREFSPLVWALNTKAGQLHLWQLGDLTNSDYDGFEDWGCLISVYGPNCSEGLVYFQCHGEKIDLSTVEQLCGWAQRYHVKKYRERASMVQPPKLSGREQDIINWVVRGKSNSVIAQILEISPHTVNSYLRSIYLKTNVNDRVSLALTAVCSGLIGTIIE